MLTCCVGRLEQDSVEIRGGGSTFHVVRLFNDKLEWLGHLAINLISLSMRLKNGQAIA